jgi:hypothetical protein
LPPDVEKVLENQADWEEELNSYIAVSDMFGMNVVIIENKTE